MRYKEKTNAEYHVEWRLKNPTKTSEYHANYENKNPGINNEQQKKHKKKVRFEVLSHYSNGVPTCACCGEMVLEFLCIDHINGGGSRDRKKTSSNIYAWLRKNAYPLGFRVLCHNCNSALGFYGYCPHSEVKCESIIK